MHLTTRILRDLLAGKSSVSAMAIRFQIPHVEVQQACDELELDLLVTSELVGSAFTVFVLTQAGRDQATHQTAP